MNISNKIKSGPRRCFDSELRQFADVLPQFLLIIVAFCAIWKFSNTMSTVTTVMLFTSVIPLTMTMQRYTVYFQQIIGYGVTRRSFADGGLMMKPVYMLFAAVLTTAAILVSGESLAIDAPMILIAASASLTVSSLGDLFGVLIQRFNKVGYVLYMVTFLATFFLIGMFGGMMAHNGVDIADFSLNVIALAALAAAIVLSAVINIVVRVILRRIAVR